MPEPFFWAVGIENAFIPEMDVDQLGWTTHRERWREDLALAATLGVTRIRYGLPWPDLNPAPGRFDWTWPDAAVEHLQRIGLEPIWDLVHFGAPAWLPDGLRDPGYPEAVTRYTAAFAARYAGQVEKITPFNEPYIASLFRGGIGAWPPFETGHSGFTRSLMPIADGLRRSIQAVREANPRAEIWLNDGGDRFRAAVPELEAEARLLTLERYAGLDIIAGLCGRGTETHELLVGAGADPGVLERWALEPTPADAIGLDYYPGTEHLIDVRSGPRSAYDWGQREDYASSPDLNPVGLAETARTYFERYGKPVYIAETSAEKLRREWLEWSTSECARARAAGVPVIGYTWWPLFDHIDWNSGLTRQVGHVCPGGLYHLRPTVRDRTASPMRDLYAATVRQGPPVDTGRREAPIPAVPSVEGEAVLDDGIDALAEP
ncbi:MAG TPA: family 1 glycosylhydrolase [Deinococcales bacterium]|nr:family 1 glycosylhydrolase [Deinococcales bacterium]